eukprot:91395-Rhodomonas_salina.5
MGHRVVPHAPSINVTRGGRSFNSTPRVHHHARNTNKWSDDTPRLPLPRLSPGAQSPTAPHSLNRSNLPQRSRVPGDLAFRSDHPRVA